MFWDTKIKRLEQEGLNCSSSWSTFWLLWWGTATFCLCHHPQSLPKIELWTPQSVNHMQRALGVGQQFWEKRKGTRPPMLWVSYSIGKATQYANTFNWCESYRQKVFQSTFWLYHSQQPSAAPHVIPSQFVMHLWREEMKTTTGKEPLKKGCGTLTTIRVETPSVCHAGQNITKRPCGPTAVPKILLAAWCMRGM